MQDSVKESLANFKTQASETVKDTKIVIAEIKAECADSKELLKNNEKEASEHNKNLLAIIEKYEQEATEKINSMNKAFVETVKKNSAAYASKQAASIEDLNKELDSYKKDMQYKFSRLQSSGGDIDLLEKVLKKAMSETQAHVLNNFQAFTTNQQKRQEEFEKSVQRDSDLLSSQITD